MFKVNPDRFIIFFTQLFNFLFFFTPKIPLINFCIYRNTKQHTNDREIEKREKRYSSMNAVKVAPVQEFLY